MIVLLYGACVGDIIELGDIMQPVTSMLEAKVSWMNRKFVISMLWLFIIVPLALYDKTSELTFTSLLALVGSCFFSIVVVIYTVYYIYLYIYIYYSVLMIYLKE